MKNIVWSDDAINDVLENIEYLETNWSENEVELFLDKMEYVFDHLKNGNITFKNSEFMNIFQVPIVKQITLFYKIENNTILLVRFWNNYKNPKKLKL
jgi:plasmid stabilization system protein ParE